MARYRPVDPNQSFPALEERILERWRERDVFHELAAPAARARRSGVFYEGPPTANGRARLPPRALARLQGHLPALQDDARATTCRARRAGTATACRSSSRSRSELGISSKARDRGRTGSPSSTQRCRESVFRYVEEWNRLTERIGFWIDLDDAYVTLDQRLHRVGLVGAAAGSGTTDRLYEGHKVVPYCPRCGTALSSHEVALGYQDVEDPSVYVRFPVAPSRDGPARAPATSCSSGRRRRGR